MHRYITEIDITDTISAEVEFEYIVSRYRPGNYYDPPEGGEVEIEAITVLGLSSPEWDKDQADLDEQGMTRWVEDVIWDKTDGDRGLYDDLYNHAAGDW